MTADMASRVRAIRERLALTQASLADRLGVNVETVRRWEQRRSTPSKLALTALNRLETLP